MKDTVIITAEITVIADKKSSITEEALARAFRDELGADDVVVTKMQIFEGADGDALH